MPAPPLGGDRRLRSGTDRSKTILRRSQLSIGLPPTVAGLHKAPSGRFREQPWVSILGGECGTDPLSGMRKHHPGQPLRKVWVLCKRMGGIRVVEVEEEQGHDRKDRRRNDVPWEERVILGEGVEEVGGIATD